MKKILLITALLATLTVGVLFIIQKIKSNNEFYKDVDEAHVTLLSVRNADVITGEMVIDYYNKAMAISEERLTYLDSDGNKKQEPKSTHKNRKAIKRNHLMHALFLINSFEANTGTIILDEKERAYLITYLKQESNINNEDRFGQFYRTAKATWRLEGKIFAKSEVEK